MIPDGLIPSYILFLIYSGMGMDFVPQPSLETCVLESRVRIGEELKVQYWDYSRPIPKVVAAFCAPGAAAK